MEELFSKVLDDDEKIVKVYKPNKTKLFVSTFVSYTIAMAFFVIVSIIGILFDSETDANPIWVLVPIGIYVAVILVVFALTHIYYKNVYFAYSNKRIIIRTGIFGIDYKSLDMSMIGVVDVYVSLIDKVIKKNTGSVTFGSAASPVVDGKYSASYKFGHIEMPYETCKEIKSYIAEYKKSISK